MPYREKTAWLSLVAMAITFGPYFAIVASTPHSGTGDAMPNVPFLRLLAMAAIAQALILGLGYMALRSKAPQESRTPPDERDRAIMRLSVSSAYYVLIVGMVLVGCVMPFNSGGWAIVNAAIFMIVLAELVHYGVIVVSYRRQT